MSTPAKIKEEHEVAVLHAALAKHNRLHGLELKIVDRPEPPDAILSDGNATTWIEHTDAFFSHEWARDLTTNAASVVHVPMEQRGYAEPDAQLAAVFCDRVIEKAAKKSYASLVSQYGPGILVVGLESPWLDSDTIEEINRAWAQRGAPDLSATFRYVYLGYRDKDGNHAELWSST